MNKTDKRTSREGLQEMSGVLSSEPASQAVPPLLLSARGRLSLGLAPLSCPLKEGESLLPQQKSFLFHSPVLKPDLDLLVTKIQAV